MSCDCTTCTCDWGRPDGAAVSSEFDAILDEMRVLHAKKSAQYGTGSDAFANFTLVATAKNQPLWVYPIDRIIEKCQRVLTMTEQGRHGADMDLLDIANLGVIVEVMRRRASA